VAHIFVVIHKEWLVARVEWIKLAVIGTAVVYAGLVWGVLAVPMAAAAAMVVMIVPICFLISRLLSIPLRSIGLTLGKPLLAGSMMFGALHAVNLESLEPATRLAVYIVAGALVYSIAILGLWFLSGRPPGIEDAVVNMLQPKSSTDKVAHGE
jgi:hypothetical protein